MKYRRLSASELAALEQSFIKFLVANGIDAALWQRMKVKELNKAEEMIDIFSDYVYESTIQKMEYLFIVTEKNLVFLKSEPLLLTIFYATAKAAFENEIDFSDVGQIEQLIAQQATMLDKILISKQQHLFKSEAEHHQKLFEYLEQKAHLTKDATIYYIFEAQYQLQLKSANLKN